MTQEHPITPSPELYKKWEAMPRSVAFEAAYRAGADQELEACCEFEATVYSTDCADKLRRHRRPKPPSLKAGAIEVLDELDGLFELPAGHYNTILRALEQLDDSL